MPDRDLSDIARRAKLRDQRAFAEMFDMFFEPLKRYALCRTRNVEVSEDIAADVLRIAIENIDNFDDNEGSLNRWMYGIARNLVARHHAEMGKLSPGPIEEPDPLSGEDLLESVIEFLRVEDLYSAVSRLPELQREVIFLRYIEGYSTRQTAEIMSRTQGSVRALQHRAVESLWKTLGGRLSDGVEPRLRTRHRRDGGSRTGRALGRKDTGTALTRPSDVY